MKKSEKDDLKKAFNIPEPERKEPFVLLYNQKIKKNKRTFNLPVFFRWTSTAVFAVLIIGLWGNLSQNADFLNKFTKDNPNIITETTTTPLTTATSPPLTSTVTSSYTIQQSSSHTVSTSSAKTYSTVTSINTTAVSQTKSIQNTLTQNPETSAVTVLLPETITTYRTTHKTTVNTSSFVTNTTVIKTTDSSVLTTKTTATTTDEPNYDPVVPETTTDEQNYEPPVTVPEPTVPDESETTTKIEDSPAVDWGKDYTVTPSVSYSKTQNVIDVSNIFEDNVVPPELNDDVMNCQQLFNNSDYIILGEIDEIIYTQIDGRPYTQENIVIYNGFKGDRLMYMDKISVYLSGGYMSAQDFADINGIEEEYPDNCSVYDSGGNNGTQNVGDIFLFCIKDGTASMPDGAFMLTTTTDISVFQYKNNKYTSLGSNSVSFNPDDLFNIP